MTAPQNGYIATSAVIAGFDSPLAHQLAERLSGIKLPVTTRLQSIDADTSLDHNLITLLETVQYIFYFLPEKFLTRAEYHHHYNHLTSVLNKITNTSQKFCLILRHPSEYYSSQNPKQFPYFSTEPNAVLEHQNHLLSCVELVKNYPGVNSRVIAGKDVIYANPRRDAPLIIESLYLGFPDQISLPSLSQIIVAPIAAIDVVNLIIKTTFSQQSKHQIYTISGQPQVAIISLAYQLQSLSPHTQAQPFKDLEIIPTALEFPSTLITTPSPKLNQIMLESVQTAQSKAPIHHARKIMAPVKPQLSIEKSTPIFPQKPSEQSVTPPPPQKPAEKIVQKTITKLKVPNPKKTISSSKGVSKTHPLTYIILSLIGIFVSTILAIPLLYINNLVGALNALKSFDIPTAVHKSTNAKKLFPFVQKTAYLYLPVVRAYVGGVSRQNLDSLLSAADQGMSIVSQADAITSVSSQTLAIMLSNDKGNIQDNFSQLGIIAQEVYQKIGSIEAALATIDQTNLKPNLQVQLQETITNLKQGRAYLQNAGNLLNVADEFFGLNGPKTYLVLLQNNHELRATGGFIGSFALVTFDQGKLMDIETHDVYTADGQLRGHVEPPAELRRYLGEANWYLRDSNWDPNFPTSARRAEWFLNKEMSRQVDGTIGIDLYVVKELLNVLGGVTLPDYNETITADNLFQRAEYHSELNYFDGSTQKKDFISALINAMYAKLEQANQQWGIGIVSAFIKNAEEGHMQISVRSDEVESSLENTVFSGKIINPTCTAAEGTQCIMDYFSIIESNVGVNKVNYFIDRSIDHQAIVSDQTINVQTDLTIRNTAQSTAWPAGTYKNYVRFLIPEYASVIGASVDGKNINPNDIIIENRLQKKYVGFYFEIPINSQKIASLSYQYTINRNAAGFIYQTFYEKQAGIGEHPLNLKINGSGIYTPFQVSEGIIIGQSASLESSTRKDIRWSASFAR